MPSFQIHQHPVFTHAAEIQQLCKPLERFGITNFCYIRIKDSKRLSYIGNNPKYAEQYFKCSYYDFDLHMDHIEVQEASSTRKYILWDNIELEDKSKELYLAGVDCGICHTFSIIEYEPKVANYYHFATGPNNHQINQFYLNNVEILMHFIQFFKESVYACKKLKSAFECNFELNKKEGSFYTSENSHFSDSYEEAIDELISETLPSRYYINTDLYLTQREIQILKWL